MVIDWSSSFSIDIIATAPDDNIFVDQRVGRVKGSYTNGEKLPKIEFLGKWQENCVVTAWSSFLFIDIITTKPCDNSYVNKNRGGIKGSPLSRQNGKNWPKTAKN